jgi:MFS family permease
MTASLFLFGNVLCSPFIYPLAAKLGLRKLVIFACVLMTIGSFVRTFVNTFFMALLFGQLIIGASVCFIINIQIQFCYNWFHPTNRPLYISLVSVMNIFGGGIGNLIPLLLVNTAETRPDFIRASVEHYTYLIFGVTILMTIATILFFQEKPPIGYGFINKLLE